MRQTANAGTNLSAAKKRLPKKRNIPIDDESDVAEGPDVHTRKRQRVDAKAADDDADWETDLEMDVDDRFDDNFVMDQGTGSRTR